MGPTNTGAYRWKYQAERPPPQRTSRCVERVSKSADGEWAAVAAAHGQGRCPEHLSLVIHAIYPQTRKKWENFMKRRLAPLALAATLLGITGTAVAAPPGPAAGSLDWPCPTFVAHLTVTGKGGFLALPGDRFKVTAPDQQVTISNLDVGGGSVSYVITGVSNYEIQADESINVTSTGSNVILVPEANGHPAGLFFTRGTVSYTLNPDGTERTLFSSQGGQVTDVCKLLA